MRRFAFAVVVAAVLFGCKESDPVDPPTGGDGDGSLFAGGKGDTVAPCAADDALVVCLTDNCPGVTGADFDECFEANCADSAADTPSECADCVVGGFSAGSDADGIATACAGTGDAGGCRADEPVLACINRDCAGLVDDAFSECFRDNCEDDAATTPNDCAFCIGSGFEASLDAEAISTACTSSDAGPGLTGVACSADDLGLFACITDNCPGADTSEAVGQCIADSCSDEAGATTVPCLVCVDSHFADGAVGSAEAACTAAGSSPCPVDVAAAIRDCAETTCSGRQGDALDECMDAECPEVFDGVTERCGNCAIGLNQNGVPLGEAASVCAGG